MRHFYVSRYSQRNTLNLSQKYDCTVYLKREDLQWVRSFKLRGVYNAISVLSDNEKNKGITCASAGKSCTRRSIYR